MKDLTLVTCSYNTPEITMTMLKSFSFHHKEKINIVLMENSTDNKTQSLLEANNIPYIRTKGATHSISVDRALKLVNTKYAFLTDTDVVFHKSILPIYTQFKDGKYATLGNVVGSRGGYNLWPRVFPWFQLIDMEQINEKGISYHDQIRIDESGSSAFYNNIPLNSNRDGKFYDVGATFLQDIQSYGLKIGCVNLENNYFTHFEGMSWQGNVPNNLYKELNTQKQKSYIEYHRKYKEQNIRDVYVYE